MRVVVVWSLFALGLAALAGHGARQSGDDVVVGVRVAAAALGAFVVAMGVCTATLLGALRSGAVVVDAALPQTARAWGLWRASLVPVVVAVGGAVVVAVLVARRGWPPGLSLLIALAIAVASARALVRAPARVRPLQRGRVRWLVVEGALPSAGFAACVGVVVAAVRYADVDAVAAGEFSRTLAVTCLGFLLLGFGAAVKAGTELRAGAVVCVDAPFAAPAPVLPGLALAAAVLLVGPLVFPALSGVIVVIVKGAVGLVVGGALAFCGAAVGHARAGSSTSSPG